MATTAVQEVADRAYRDALAAVNAAGRVASVRELQERVADALINCVGYGVVDVDDVTKEWAEHEARRADRRQTSAGKDVIRQVANGQLAWDDLLDVVCPVGEGGRVLFKNMGANDLVAANELRYSNVRAAQVAFDDWTVGIFNRALPVLVARGVTFGEAVARGWLV